MTYLQGMGVVSLGMALTDLSADPLVQLGIGASYGLFDFLQLDVLVPVLRVSPTLEADNPSVALLARFVDGGTEFGMRVNVVIPIHERPELFFDPWPDMHLLADTRRSNVVQLDVSLPFRFHLGEIASLDIRPMGTLAIGEGVDVAINIPIRLNFQLGEYAYAGIDTGLHFPGLNPTVGLGLLAGATIPGSRRGPIVDAQVRFGWPRFMDTARIGDPIDIEFWQLTVGAKVMTYLLP